MPQSRLDELHARLDLASIQEKNLWRKFLFGCENKEEVKTQILELIEVKYHIVSMINEIERKEFEKCLF